MQLTKRVATLGGTYPGAPFFIESRFAADARCWADLSEMIAAIGGGTRSA
jgi:hypothetical protein